MPLPTCDQHTFVLTGAAGGIGRAIALRLAGSGATLALVDRDAPGLAAVAAALPGGGHTTHVFDLQRLDALTELLAGVTAAHAKVHGVIHNAGLTVHATFADQTAAEIDRVLDVDLRAVLHLTRVFLPALRAAGAAQIVTIASMAGLAGFPFQSTYCAAKFALRGFGEALRPELAPLGIGVTTILPGTIATGFLAAAGTHDKAVSDRLAALMLRFGSDPDRVARAVERAIVRDPATVRVGWDCHLLAWVQWACPPLVPWVLRTALRRGAFGAATAGRPPAPQA